MAQLNLARHHSLGEAELVRLAQAGDADAFRVIMQRCNQRLFRVARSVVSDAAEAEDVVQEAYTRAFAAIGDFRAEASILTWLTRIALNEARGRLRRRRPTVGLEQVEAAQGNGAEVIHFPMAGQIDSPEGNAARSQIRELIESAVDDLPDAFRVVFVMRDIEECTIEETARTLDLKPETVKTRLHRARRLLRGALEDKLAATMTGAFPFLGARCEAITQRVLERLQAAGRLR
jgi:RNA polymerase sigma-70 factor (ECF subfamily)